MTPHAHWQRPLPHVDVAAAEVHVWRVSLDAFAQRDAPHLSRLSEHELQRASRFRFEADRRRFIYSHAALRGILAIYLDASPATLLFAEGAHGKPFLLDPSRGRSLRFSLSHSGDLALVAVSREREVGVDLERVRPGKDFVGVADRFFSPAERDALARVAPDDRQRAFLAAWVLKEAYLKACGEGLLRRLDAFDVTIGDEEQPRLLAVRDRVGDEARWSLRHVDPGEGFVAALSVEGRGWRLRTLMWQGVIGLSPRGAAGPND